LKILDGALPALLHVSPITQAVPIPALFDGYSVVDLVPPSNILNTFLDSANLSSYQYSKFAAMTINFIYFLSTYCAPLDAVLMIIDRIRAQTFKYIHP